MHRPGHDLCDQVGLGGASDARPWARRERGRHPVVRRESDAELDGNGEFATLRVLDTTVEPPQILGTTLGPGHSIDWFRTADGREYVLHANEIVANPRRHLRAPRAQAGRAGLGVRRASSPRSPTRRRRRGYRCVELAITKPENCAAMTASGQNAASRLPQRRQPARCALRDGVDGQRRAARVRHPQPGSAERGGVLQPRRVAARGRLPLRRRERDALGPRQRIPGARVRSLLASRESLYASAAHTVDTSGRPVERIVEEIAGLSKI